MSYDYSENILVQESAGHLLEDELGWRVELAYNTEVLGETGTFGRKSYKEILLVKYLKEALLKLNPWLTPALLEDAIKTFESHMSSASLMQINEENYRHIRDGIPVKVKKQNGQIEEKKAIVIDFTNPENNDFLAIREMKIHGDLYRRRTDIVGFVNGIPLLFIELKKNSVDVQNAYTDNYTDYLDTIPHTVKNKIIQLEHRIEKKIDFSTGTIIKISNLRDEWTNNQIERIKKSMEFLIPPKEQDEFYICQQKSIDSGYELIENNFSDEFDYKIKSVFDGENFMINLYRNEFDVDKIPENVFREERFMRYPYRKEDFKVKCLEFTYSISQLFNTSDSEYIERIKQIGSFTFEYIFMKLQNQKKEVFFYKEIGKTRNEWLEEHGGIKIYRDNFWVRPYGENGSDSFDWLGLEARNNANPVAVSSKTEAWTVRNAQGQGTVFISRINNASILDKSSREGIIENESFKLLKDALIRIISILEKDRAYIARSFKIYDDRVNHKEKTKQEGSQIAKSVLSGKKDKNYKAQKEKMESLAKTVQYFEEEREELITELKLLRALATNGLITTSIVHDLKSINALLVNRVEPMRMAIENNNKMLIERNLNDLYKNDQFLKSWITVVTNQSKKDKRKRLKKNIYDTIEKIVNVLQPILVQKKVQVELIKDEQNAERRIFESDFESIFYNLIINSIEAFSKSSTKNRKIRIELKTNENLVVNYLDNGDGLDNKFKNPYEIFTLGSTSKYDQFGNVIGTGLGMYIIASTVREYNGDYKLTQIQNGFGLEIRIPL